MKEETKLQKISSEILSTLRKHSLSPQQVRYVFKLIRENGNYQVQKRARKSHVFLTPAEVHALLEKANKDSFNSILVHFLIKTGLRINEARNLLIQDIDFHTNQIKVVEGKGSKDREVPLEVGLKRELLLYLQGRNKGYVFHNNGKRYSKRALQYRVKNVIDECNFTKDVKTHTLRHTFACMCLVRGLSKEQVQTLMGHDSIKTTEIYAKLTLSGVKDDFLRLMGGFHLE